MADKRYRMIAKIGAHSAYAEDNFLVVYWYDFGDHAPYESGNSLIFDDVNARMLAQAVGGSPAGSLDEIAASVAEHFASYWRVRTFADERKIAYQHKVDFWP